jgi:hypothetical protein
MSRPKRKRSTQPIDSGTTNTPTSQRVLLRTVTIHFTSVKPPKINFSMTVSASQTFHAVKTKFAEEQTLNPLSIRFLSKNKAVGDSKSVKEVFGDAAEGQITVMVMKVAASATREAEMSVDYDAFWEEIRRVVMEKYPGPKERGQVFEALKRGYAERFETQ